MFRKQSVSKPLPETAGSLKDLIHDAFNDLYYAEPRDSYMNSEFLPEKIHESKTAETDCNAALALKTVPAELNLEELSSLTDKGDFDMKFGEYNYSRFIDEMISFVASFEMCTSYYSSYIDTVASLGSSFLSLSKRSVSFGESFIFEKESKVNCLRHNFIYKTNFGTCIMHFDKMFICFPSVCGNPLESTKASIWA